jgi:hypothetical protein
MSFGKASSINLAGRSLYKRHGKPQYTMAEIKRMLSQNISGQITRRPFPATAGMNISLSNPRRFQ